MTTLEILLYVSLVIGLIVIVILYEDLSKEKKEFDEWWKEHGND